MLGGRPFLPRARIVTVAVFIGMLVLVGGVNGATLNVPSNYSTIQAAINAANPGDTINVSAGTYSENVDVNKSVNLVGAGADVTIVNASDSDDHVFDVSNVNSVNISGFTVTGATDIYLPHKAGIYIYDSNYSKIENINATNNSYGIYLYSSSSNNLTNNTANSNSEYGIYLESSSYNTIYNNLFNNTANFAFSGTNNNDWNTTRQAGTNILGGPYLGGNFWAKPDGTGFSETCTDADWDGICDSNYTLASGNVDYLPLSLNIPDITVCSSGCDYTSIQAAINGANVGDTIHVAAGTYNENVDVNKSVNLLGAGPDVTIVNASTPNGHVIEVTANWVNVSGFTVVGSESNAGVFLSDSDYSKIENLNSSNMYGIWLDASNNNIISNNTVLNNDDGGIILTSSVYNSIVNNHALNNAGGIVLADSSNNTIAHNNASNNSVYGIYHISSSDNTIYNNYFNNTNNSLFGDTSTGIWNTTKQAGGNVIGGPYLGGNFWAHPNGTGFSETCTDTNWDGICDSNYTLADGNVDYLPLSLNIITVCSSGCDYTSIQAAVNAANVGDTIHVAAGTYNENVDVNKSVNLIGEGAAVTIVNASDSSDQVVYVTANSVNISSLGIVGATANVGIYLDGVSNAKISNNSVRENFQGIYLESSNNNQISDNIVISNTNSGIHLNNSNGSTISENNASNNLNYYGIYVNYGDNNRIIDNTADSNRKNGIYLWSSRGNVIRDNHVSNNEEYNGISIDVDSDNNVIDSNVVKSNKNNGIGVWESDNNTISNNNATGNGGSGFEGSGIYLYLSTNSTISNNSASNNEHGIHLHSSNGNVLVDNNASLNSRHGILLNSSSNNTLKNNTASNNDMYGVWLVSSSYNVLTNNNVLNNNEGIYLYSSGNNEITNNNADSNTYDGIYLWYSNYNNITNNNANSNTYDGIRLYDSSNYNIITDNVVLDNKIGIHLKLSSDFNTITNNTASNNLRGGIILSPANGNTLIGNAISNSEYGIWLESSNNTTLYHNNFINNTNQSYDNGNNTWDNGHPDGGNYWSDYDESSEGCNDANTDGFCDSPYNISGGSNQDMYPFVSQDGWNNIRDTQNGTNVSVVFPGCGMNMTFGRIVGTGKTTGVRSLRSSGITPPSGYKSAGIFYNISTTANFTGSFEVCVTDFDIIPTYRLFHRAGTAWEDITTTVDADNDILCGMASSLSPFEVMEPSSDSGSSGSSGGGGGASKPKIILLANSIDYNLSANFTAMLKTNGIDITYTTPKNFSGYNTSKFIVILGGPDAHDGVGEIVREVLNESGQSHLRTKGNRKMYVKTSVWATGQVVMIIAGSDRGQTRQAGEENKLAAKKNVKGY